MSTADGQKTPEQIRAEIDATRAGLSYDVDTLADKVNPSSIAHRQTEKVKGRFSSVKESVMGSAHDGAGSVSDAASSATGSAQEAGHQAVEKAKGNALAVGLIAFGVGALVASLLPSTEKERDLTSQAKEKAAPAVDAAKSAAQDVASNLKQPAQDAVASVKDTAQSAADTVADDARSAAGDVQDSAQQSRDAVQGA
jgi:hypothetical protein